MPLPGDSGRPAVVYLNELGDFSEMWKYVCRGVMKEGTKRRYLEDV